MRSLRAPCLAIALCLCAVAIAPAVEARFAPTSPEAALAFAGPREQSLLAELNAGSLRSEDVFTAALTAQGTASESQFRAAGERLAGHVARLQGRLAPRATAAERARAAYAYLHGEVLTGQYVTECSDLTTTLERGDYNCLSATVLYLALCQGVAVPAEAVARPGHVYCRLAESGEAVETTCPQWFSLTAGQRRRSVPPGAVGSATQADRPLTTAELLAKIYYNRGLAEMGRRQFPAAIAHFALAARLDPRDAAARENVLAAMNNGALALGEAGQWAAAVVR